jgi:uncharacterized protein
MTESSFKNYPGMAQSIGITVIVILGMLLFSPLKLLLDNLMGEEASMLIYYILSIGVPFWIVFTIRKKQTGNSSFNWNMKDKGIIPFIMVGAIALLFGIVTPLSSLIPMPESVKELFLELVRHIGIFSFLLMVVAAPILEELIFRGIILEGLLNRYSAVKSILLSSFLFGFVHLNPWQFVTGFILGIFIGWVYYRTKSLVYPIIIHATANLTGFLMRIFLDIDSQADKTLLESYGGMTNLLLSIFGSIIILWICIFFLNKMLDRMKKVVP